MGEIRHRLDRVLACLYADSNLLAFVLEYRVIKLFLLYQVPDAFLPQSQVVDELGAAVPGLSE